MRLRSDGAGDCSAFGRAIPDGFCQSSFNGAGETKLCVQNMAPVAEVIPSILR